MAAPLTPAQRQSILTKWAAAKRLAQAALNVATKYRSPNLGKTIAAVDALVPAWSAGNATDDAMASALLAVNIAIGDVTLSDGTLVLDAGPDAERAALISFTDALPAISSKGVVSGDDVKAESLGMSTTQKVIFGVVVLGLVAIVASNMKKD